GEDTIEFAEGRKTFAGYGRDEARLRDHKQANFLVDVIATCPERMTGFCLPWRQDEGIGDIVRYDKRSHVVLVRGNVFRAFLEHRRKKQWLLRKSDGQECLATLPPIEAGSQEFVEFYGEYAQYYADKAKALNEAGT